MTARRGTAVAGAAVAVAVAAFATSGRADTAAPAKQTATPSAKFTAPHAAARERPRGVVLACPRISGIGGLREFRSRWNLVVGPLAVKGAGARPVYYTSDFGGQKLPVLVRGGHRVTLELPRKTQGVGLLYGQMPVSRVVTFIACRRGQIKDDIVDGRPVSGWSGALLADSPRCVPLLVWVDDEPRPRRAVVYLGVRDCG